MIISKGFKIWDEENEPGMIEITGYHPESQTFEANVRVYNIDEEGNINGVEREYSTVFSAHDICKRLKVQALVWDGVME